jgi:hypothetical protein
MMLIKSKAFLMSSSQRQAPLLLGTLPKVYPTCFLATRGRQLIEFDFAFLKDIVFSFE